MFKSARIIRRLLSYHSKPVDATFEQFKVKIIPALEDNYMYMLIDSATNQAAAVDPVEPDKIIKVAKEENVNLTTVLTTHHHWDHAGGNKDLISKVNGLSVYGGDDRIDGLTEKVVHNTKFSFGLLSVTSLHTPGHTNGHFTYFVKGSQDNVAFTGDALFVAGCGKLFEGTPEQMYHSVVDVISNLPLNTNLFCGHEYTVSNLKFAEFVDSANVAVKNKLGWAKKRRENNVPTVPSTIADELLINPFLRVDKKSLQERCGTISEIETFAYLRNEKDNF